MKHRFLAALVGISLLAAPLNALGAATDTGKAVSKPKESPTQTYVSKLQWRNLGPYIGGRVVAIAGVPSEPNHFYMGGVQAGIWESTNYGHTWNNISDGKMGSMNAYSIGALAVAPSNKKIIYAGTGEADIRGDVATGDGVYRSTDGGKTWKHLGLADTHNT
ncbi:MAG TPA: hypothetical protein VFL13_10015, partial [Candidatus Baltobacteraceae bacterium]|nr:hypothetical protein [Candidatus Baltobacteraceae bacterium]